MTRSLTRRWFVLVVFLLCAWMLSCRNTQTTRTYNEPPPPGLKPTLIDYVEQDAFDAIFENALVNQDPVILIQTETSRADWGSHLNTWIAAWNRGGKVPDEPPSKVRMQAPLPAVPGTVNGDTVREFRLLIDDLMTRVENLARLGSSWWEEERTQSRRIALLKPYSLRFHMDADKHIQLIFFNGNYSRYYRDFMKATGKDDTEESEEWARDLKCSHCKAD